MNRLFPFLAALALAFSADAATVITHTKGAPAVAKVSASRNPILFVTQFPVGGFASTTSPFAQQKTDLQSAGRGGDLMIVYPDGTLRNLTQEAGYGSTGTGGFQDHNAIAVRDPQVYWDGSKAIFSMVVGAPDRQYQQGTWYWQLYEVTGLQQGAHATITKVAGQPQDFNNIFPTYGTGGAIYFATDMTRSGPSARYLYPQLDEYESTPTTTGVWKLQNGQVTQLVDAPSGDFHARVDWYGRIVFTEWDHLQRDQQCDTAAAAQAHGCKDFASEAEDAATTTSLVEIFPELRIGADESKINNRTFNAFQPWAVNQDGTTLETVDHVGRHEIETYFSRSFTDDPALHDYTAPNPETRAEQCHQIEPIPTSIGDYLCVDAPEFETQAAGAIWILHMPLGGHADQQPPPHFLTSKSNNHQWDTTPPADFSGHYRDPIKLTSGEYISAWDQEPGSFRFGDRANPTPNYHFRLYQLTVGSDGYLHATQALTGGISKTVKYYDPDVLVTYTGNLWEIEPTEVVARPEPPMTETALETPELAAFNTAGVDPATFKAWLIAHDAGLLVSRNVTSRDDADQQQPYNLRVPNGVKSTANGGKLYDISTMQIVEGDAVRGNTGRDGRRKLARSMTEPAGTSVSLLPNPSGGLPGSVSIYPDGSVAAVVPATRALSWQTVDPANNPVVRERYWLTVGKGEVRACDSCHGTNTLNQSGNPPPQNTPAALTDLLAYWKAHQGGDVCTNPHPDQTPVCPDGSHQTGGTWTQAPFPGCAWTYVGGVCPQPAKMSVNVTSAGKACPSSFDALSPFTTQVVPNPAWTPGVHPIAVPQWLLKVTQGDKTCTLPRGPNAVLRFGG